MIEPISSAHKPIEWIASSKDDLSEMPDKVKLVFGQALYEAQTGRKHPDAKPLKGVGEFKGAGILEIVEDFNGDTYRAIYTVKFADVIYVLHAFQKKSTRGIATPKHVIDLVKSRYKFAEQHYEENYRP